MDIYNLMKYNISLKRASYGEVYIIKTKYIGLVLDLIVPCTFGLITLFMIKLLGSSIRLDKKY